MDNVNQWDTVEHGKQDAIENTMYHELPPFLTVLLNRFESSASNPIKLNKLFQFKNTMDLKKLCKSATNNYKLHSIIAHNGRRATDGHYTAFIDTKDY